MYTAAVGILTKYVGSNKLMIFTSILCFFLKKIEKGISNQLQSPFSKWDYTFQPIRSLHFQRKYSSHFLKRHVDLHIVQLDQVHLYTLHIEYGVLHSILHLRNWPNASCKHPGTLHATLGILHTGYGTFLCTHVLISRA